MRYSLKRFGWGLALTVLLASCVAPTDGWTRKTTLSILLGEDSRNITPNTTSVTLTLSRGSEELETVTGAWNGLGSSFDATLSQVPLGTELTLKAEAFYMAPLDTNPPTYAKAVTGTAETTFTLFAGDNTVRLAIVPTNAELLVLDGEESGLYMNSGDWTAYEFNPGNASFFKVMVPYNVTGYLQSPSGSVTRIFNPSRSLVGAPGKWSLMYVADSTAEGYTSVVSSGTADYGFTVSRIVLHDIEPGLLAGARVYDYDIADSYKRLDTGLASVGTSGRESFSIELPGGWSVGPQQILAVYAKEPQDESPNVIQLSTEFTSPNTSGTVNGGTLHVYQVEESQVAFLNAKPAPTGVSVVIGLNFATVSWNPIAGVTNYNVRYLTNGGEEVGGSNYTEGTTMTMARPWLGDSYGYQVQGWYTYGGSTVYGTWSEPVYKVGSGSPQ